MTVSIDRRDRTRARAAGQPAERIRAAGAGIGGFCSPTGAGTELAAGREERTIDGRRYVQELPLRADVAIVSALRADRWGNLVHRKTARNFGPIMATAARTTVVQVDEIVPLGVLDPEAVVTPGIFVDRVVAIGARRWLTEGRFHGGVDVEGAPLEQEGASGISSATRMASSSRPSHVIGHRRTQCLNG